MFVVSICACWILLQNDAKTHVAVVFLDIKEIFFCKTFTCNDKTWHYSCSCYAYCCKKVSWLKTSHCARANGTWNSSMDTQGYGASHMKNSITNPSLNGPLKRSPQDIGCGHSQGGLFYCTSLACERSSGVLKVKRLFFFSVKFL